MWKLGFINLLIIFTGCTIVTGNPNYTPTVDRGIIPTNKNCTRDGGFFSYDPCGPPCFYGISPGITTDTEVMELIKKSNNTFNHCESYDVEGSRGVWCDYIDIGYQNSIVEVVGFTPSTSIIVQDVIDFYGSPDLVGVYITSFPEESVHVSMGLYYDQIQTVMGFQDQEEKVFTISSGSLVKSIIYLEINSYYESRDITEGKTPWIGYGKYAASAP